VVERIRSIDKYNSLILEDEITEVLRKLHDEEFQSLYPSPLLNQIDCNCRCSTY
jgi:hypothetical protein